MEKGAELTILQVSNGFLVEARRGQGVAFVPQEAKVFETMASLQEWLAVHFKRPA